MADYSLCEQFNLGSWNFRAVNKVDEWKDLAVELEKFNIHIAGMQERRPKWVSQFEMNNFRVYQSPTVESKDVVVWLVQRRFWKTIYG